MMNFACWYIYCKECSYLHILVHIVYRFWMMPALLLKKMVMGNFDRHLTEPEIADSIDFMVQKVSFEWKHNS